MARQKEAAASGQPIQISPISAAKHYAAGAGFWEQHAKMLQHQLDEATSRVIELERELAAQARLPKSEGN